jgi:chromosome segregation ATPase
MEAEELCDNKQEITILLEQVKKLEEENSELYENILKMGNKKQKKSLEYYVRLKNDLLIEEFKLSQQLLNMEKDKEQDKKAFSFKINNLKKKLNEILSENKTLKSLVDTHNKELGEKDMALNKRNVLLVNDVDEKEIEKLETKVTNLTNTLSEKELIVQEQKEKMDELQNKIDSINGELTAKINDIKSQYDNVYSASKQNEENFNKLYEDKTNNMKEDIQSNKYQLEKKLVHSKNLINNIKNENGILNNLFESDSQIKENEINSLKSNLDEINNVYNEFSQLCGGNLEKLKNNVRQMKEIYMNRENEIENMSKVYVESMNNYGEAIQEAEKNKNLMNTDSDENKALIEKLKENKNKLEQALKQLKSFKAELVGENSNNIKAKISNMNGNLNYLNEKQNEFSMKIKKVMDFSNSMTKNSKIVD